MKTMAEVLAEHKLDVTVYLITDAEYLCICGKRSTCHENHQEDALSAAGYGPVRESAAEALRDAAEHFRQRSDTLQNTMQEMTASREYGLEDIVRYGAYSAEANTTATWLRTQAAKTAAS